MSQHPLEIDPIITGWLPNLAGKRVLDLGCGKGSLGLLLRQAPGGLRAHLTAAEIFQPNIDFVRRFNIYDEIFEGDIAEKDHWPDFDVVVACEILEHLPRDAAERLLGRMEEHAPTVIVSTPNGRDLRGPIGGNPAEAHLSVWTVADFKTRGYEVKGVGSLLHRGSRKNLLTAVAWHASTPFASRMPRIAGNIAARRVVQRESSVGT
jgi:2-polyprenyl-3-methyl-5-hydroxy-6-metoxy-1,4-benzoquinol methylase